MTAYFDTNWAIQSTIGIATFFFALLVIAVTELKYLSIIPLVVSVAGAVANGLSYYGQYVNTEPTISAAVWAIADILWMIQEAGLSFYSYAIVTRILRSRERLIYTVLFWFLMLCILASRSFILGYRVRSILNGNDALKIMVNAGHIGYFLSLALVESLSAFFLLRTFATAKTSSEWASSKVDLFKYLMRSTEIRLTLLALIGVARVITFFFQPPVRGGNSATSQVDTFFYALECLFPVVLLIDMLSSKLASAQSRLTDSHSLSTRIHTTSGPLSPDRRRRTSITSTWGDGESPSFRYATSAVHARPNSVSEGVETRGGSFSITSQAGIMKTVEITVHSRD